jgi:NADH dehydrogenase FAD-containing subunit
MTLLTAWGEIEETERRARLRALRALVHVLGGGATGVEAARNYADDFPVLIRPRRAGRGPAAVRRCGACRQM